MPVHGNEVGRTESSRCGGPSSLRGRLEWIVQKKGLFEWSRTSIQALPAEISINNPKPFNVMKSLEKYLNEHLAGSGSALGLLETLAEHQNDDSEIYLNLRRGIFQNRLTLESLIHQLGYHRNTPVELAVKAVSQVALLRFKHHGLVKGQLGLVEALEALALGVHGQTLLWRSLAEEGPSGWSPSGVDLPALLQSAEAQKVQVERLRLAAVQAAFFPPPAAPPASPPPAPAAPDVLPA